MMDADSRPYSCKRSLALDSGASAGEIQQAEIPQRGHRINLGLQKNHTEPGTNERPQGSLKTRLLFPFSSLRTLYLFPCNDVPTMIIPVTFLGTMSGLSTQASTKELADVLLRVPWTFSWVWLNVLIFSISNQRGQASILEDRINKPWRPLPSQRISPTGARQLLLVGVPAILAISVLCLGAAEETALCLILTWMYNDLGGADEHFLIRNGINSVAYFVYGAGAIRVSANCDLQAFDPGTAQWLGVVAGIIFTTMHIQDLKDQKGDRARNRSTAPLAAGDCFSRWSIVVSVAAWSLICPRYWSLHLTDGASVGVLSLASMVSFRLMRYRLPRADAATYKWWSIWLMAIFSLPLVALAR